VGFFFGLGAGAVAIAAFGLVMGLIALPAIFFGVQRVPVWLLVLLGTPTICIMVTAPFWYAIKLARKELREQNIAFRTATNRCLHCGYSLSGIRRLDQRCPECGELFKPL